MKTALSVFLLTLLAQMVVLIHSQAEALPTCGLYREFDPLQANVPQYEAPNGCLCVDNMSGMHCGYCEGNNDPCQAWNATEHCVDSFVYAAGDSYKSYKCVLGKDLEGLFENGKFSVHVDRILSKAQLVIFNQGSINNDIAVDCGFEECTFPTGQSGGSCQNIHCECGWQCNPITKGLVESIFQDKPATMTVDESTGELTLQVEGSPFPIGGQCTAAACVYNPNWEQEGPGNKEDDDTGNDDDDDDVKDDKDKEDTGLSTFSQEAILALVILIVVFGLFTLLGCATYLPIVLLRRSGKQQQQQQQQSLPETNISNGEEEQVETPLTTNHNPNGDDAKGNVDRLGFQNVTVVLPSKKNHAQRTILQSVQGSVQSGQVCGIMGPSGAGKTTLLNVLGGCASTNHQIKVTKGSRIQINGQDPPKDYKQSVVGYVGQTEFLYETLTVRECIEYSALLRLPNTMAQDEKQDQIQSTIQALHLNHIVNSRIGNPGRGISGGERKRVAIGMEWVLSSHRKILLLDEPTSGLDSFAAHHLMQLLSNLAHSQNKIVILSIHQPSHKCFRLMDQILLLAQGQVLYHGNTGQAAMDYFHTQGFTCPPSDTISDYMLEVATNPDHHKRLTNAAQQHPYEDDLSDPEDGTNHDNHQNMVDEAEPRISVFSEITILFERTTKDLLRNKSLFLLQSLTSVLVAFLAAGIFHDVTNNLAGFQNRMGAFYFSLTFFGFASFSGMDMYLKERRIFTRESGSHYYRVFSYFFSKTVLDAFLLRVLPVTVFCCILYWIMGLKPTAEAFLVFWAAMVLFSICAGVMSTCISIAAPQVGVANLMAAVWFLIMLLFGGFLVNIETMSPGYAWIRYISIFFYTFEILITNELTNVLLSFDAPGYPEIPIYGEVFLQTIGMEADHQTRDFVCLLALIVGFALLSYILLCLRVPASTSTISPKKIV